MISGPWRRVCDADVPFRTRYSTVSYFLCFGQWWILRLIPICWKQKLLRWRWGDVLIYGYNCKLVEAVYLFPSMVVGGIYQALWVVYLQTLGPENDARFHLVEWNINPLRKYLVTPTMSMILLHLGTSFQPCYYCSSQGSQLGKIEDYFSHPVMCIAHRDEVSRSVPTW